MGYSYVLQLETFLQRDTVINGEYEPTDEECEWESDDEDDDEKDENSEEKLSVRIFNAHCTRQRVAVLINICT